MKRLTFVISSMRCGGAQRVMSIIANEFSRSGHQVTLILLDDGSDVFYPLDDEVQLKPLNLFRQSQGVVDAAMSNVKRLFKLRRALQQSRPDVVLSFMDTTNVMVLMSGFRNAPIFVAERINPKHHDIGPVWTKLREATYRFASGIVAQATDIKDLLAHHGPPVSIIQNPIHYDNFPVWTGGEKRIVAAGRLVEQKGFSFLIKAFESVHAKFPEYRVEIYGEGPLRADLQQQIDRASLTDHVRLMGKTATLFDVLSTSELFVLPSRFEGFPNVLIEAMACGVASVAFDCPSGPADIVSHAPENGALVSLGDSRELADAMIRYLEDDKLRRSVGRAGHASVAKLDVRENMKLWSKLLQAPL